MNFIFSQYKHKTEYMCYNQTGDITTLDGTPLKPVDNIDTTLQMHYLDAN